MRVGLFCTGHVLLTFSSEMEMLTIIKNTFMLLREIKNSAKWTSIYTTYVVFQRSRGCITISLEPVEIQRLVAEKCLRVVSDECGMVPIFSQVTCWGADDKRAFLTNTSTCSREENGYHKSVVKRELYVDGSMILEFSIYFVQRRHLFNIIAKDIRLREIMLQIMKTFDETIEGDAYELSKTLEPWLLYNEVI